MPIDPNKLTRKTTEALGAAQALAGDQNHSQVTPEHLLAALVAQPESVVLPVLERLGVATKVVRDRIMERLDRVWPAYGFARHKGYGTPEHLEAIQRHGPCPIHRYSFTPVRVIELPLF